MPMEIRLHIVDKREMGFDALIKDLEEILDFPTVEDFDFDKGTHIHHYLEDRFSNLPEQNRGHYERNLGSLGEVITVIEQSIEYIHNNGSLEGLFKICYIDEDAAYDKLTEQLETLLTQLKEHTDAEHKHVILSWW